MGTQSTWGAKNQQCESFYCEGPTFNGTNPDCEPMGCTVQDEISALDTDTCVGRKTGHSCVMICPNGYFGTPMLLRCNGTTGNFCPYSFDGNPQAFSCTDGKGNEIKGEVTCGSNSTAEPTVCSIPPTPEPTPEPTGNFSLPMCSAHPKCSRLSGNCCPTNSGTRLSCCTQPYTTYVPTCDAHEGCKHLSGNCCPTMDPIRSINLGCCSNITFTMPWWGMSLVFQLEGTLARRLVSAEIEAKIKAALTAVHNTSTESIEILNVQALPNTIYDVGYAVQLDQDTQPVIDDAFQNRFAEVVATEFSSSNVRVVEFEALETEEVIPTTTTLDMTLNSGHTCEISLGIAVVTMVISSL